MADAKPIKIASTGNQAEFASTDTIPTGNLGTGVADATTYLRGDQSWQLPPGSNHALLSATHTDTTASVVARGDLIVGIGASPTWDNLALGATGKVLRSNGTDLLYSTFTIPDTMAINTLLYASAANVLSALTTANSGILVTSATGVPSIATDIPTAVTIGGQYVYRVGGTKVAITDGGTGQSTKSAAFDALSPMTTAGDLIYGGASGTGTRLAIGTANQVLHGGASAPAYSAVVEADLTLADNTTGDVSTTKHGFAPKAPNVATKYLDGTGVWSTPAGGGTAEIKQVSQATPAATDYTTTSMTFVNVDTTNLTLTQTVAANEWVLILVSIRISSTNYPGSSIVFTVTEDGTDLAPAGNGLAVQNGSGSNEYDCPMFYVLRQPTAASHTWKLQWRISGSGTAAILTGSASQEHLRFSVIRFIPG